MTGQRGFRGNKNGALASKGKDNETDGKDKNKKANKKVIHIIEKKHLHAIGGKGFSQQHVTDVSE